MLEQAPFWYGLGPALLLVGAGLAMWTTLRQARLVVGLSLAVAVIMDFFVPAHPWSLGGLLVGGGLVRALAVVILGAAGGIVGFGGQMSEDGRSEHPWPALVALSTASSLVALGADDVYLLVGSLEMAYLPVLWLATRGRDRSLQTGFVAAGLSAALLLWGAASLAHQAGTASLTAWPRQLVWSPQVGTALGALLFGLAWKLMILPFGLGFFEMFERAAWPTTALLQTVFFPVGALVAGKVVLAVQPSQAGARVLLVMGTLGILFAAFGLARRRSVRGLSLALGSLAASWMILSWVAQARLLGDGSPGFVLMVASWTVALLALSVAGYGMEAAGEAPIPGGKMPARWYGLSKREPFLAIGLLAALANALGSPFTAGFVARLALLRGLVDVSVLSTLLLLVAWVVGLQPLLSLGAVFFGSDLPPSVPSSHARAGRGALVVIWTAAAVGIAVGILPGGTWRLILAAMGR